MSWMMLNLFALLALVPAALVPLRPAAGRDAVYWGAVTLAVAGPAAWVAGLAADGWPTGLSATLWVSIAATTALFALTAFVTRQAWRLAPLLMPFLAALGLLGLLVHGIEAPRPLIGTAPAAWLDLHIVVSVLTYALFTLAAVASLGAFLQERALKQKRGNALVRLLPSVADGEDLAGRLLLGSETVLGLGVLTGMATQYLETSTLMVMSHKTLFSLVAFVLIGLLLIGHRVCGVRGRLAARVVMVAYLLLTLAFPGVKFVTQVLIP